MPPTWLGSYRAPRLCPCRRRCPKMGSRRRLPEAITLEALGALLLLAEAPKPKKQTKPKPDLKTSAEEAKRERDDMLRKIKALLSTDGRTAEEASFTPRKRGPWRKSTWTSLVPPRRSSRPQWLTSRSEDEIGADIDGDALLTVFTCFLMRFVTYPSRHASVAHTLWCCAHTYDGNLG